MVKDYTPAEFSEYVKALNFTDMGDMLIFVRAYLEAYRDTPPDDKDIHFQAYAKYMIVLQEFGPSLLAFAEGIWMLKDLAKAKEEFENVDKFNSLQSKH